MGGTSGTSTTSTGVKLKTSPSVSGSMPSLVTGAGDYMMVELMLFDVVLAWLLQILASLPCPSLPSHAILRSATASHKVFKSAKEYFASQERLAALEACLCVRSYMEGGRRLDASAPPVLHWVVATAWKTLRHDKSDEGAWLRELLIVKGPQVIANGLWTSYKWLNSLPE